ncbi:rhomboid family intramembrane serine protease GlpG [Neiella marina]|uniref:Rhomboid family intramembrane serine protease GlpG n=1 Tax=Neiella holothuriorum TaxID=2870530 RepID=A0ABS7EHT0_9GAMM|nr:rhomboid family intramembrane serine protease GlpG [Neiella holothuriorum]MBW8191227.1 rhomboid family intramembrane serine protease GlpG [Neiella holothuriorum]
MQLGRLTDARLAQAFVDYMAVQGMPCEIREDGHYFSIDVVHSEQLDAARREFQQFAEQPNHPKYRSASWQRADRSGAQFDYGSSGTPILHQIWLHAGPLTLVILGACLVLGLLSQIGFASTIFGALHFPAPFVEQWMQIWRMFTPALMHFAMVHLLFNVVWWWYLGGRIERVVGTPKLLELLLIGALFSNTLQGFLVDANFLGLSGVVYALLGYIAVVQRSKPELAMPPAYIGFMLFWLALGFAGVLGQQVANYAHLGGLLVGAAQGWLDARKSHR